MNTEVQKKQAIVYRLAKLENEAYRSLYRLLDLYVETRRDINPFNPSGMANYSNAMIEARLTASLLEKQHHSELEFLQDIDAITIEQRKAIRSKFAKHLTYLERMMDNIRRGDKVALTWTRNHVISSYDFSVGISAALMSDEERKIAEQEREEARIKMQIRSYVTGRKIADLHLLIKAAGLDVHATNSATLSVALGKYFNANRGCFQAAIEAGNNIKAIAIAIAAWRIANEKED